MDAKILIVEDERDIVDLLRYHLQEAGFDTDYVRNGADALHQAVENPPDLILVRLDAPRGGRAHCLSFTQERPTDEKYSDRDGNREDRSARPSGRLRTRSRRLYHQTL